MLFHGHKRPIPTNKNVTKGKYLNLVINEASSKIGIIIFSSYCFSSTTIIIKLFTKAYGDIFLSPVF